MNKPKSGKTDSQFASEEYAIPSASQVESGGKGGGKKGVRVCAYYNSARGCLKGAECEFRHEDPQPKGKGAKGGKDAKAAAEAEAKAEAKRKAKADKKAAKAAAKAAAVSAPDSATASSATAASVTAEAIPLLAGASSGPPPSTSYKVMMSRGRDEDSERNEDDEGEVPSLAGADSVSIDG